MSSGTMYRVALVRTDALENISPPSPKRPFELELHDSKSQKASIIDTAMKVSQKTVFFDHKYRLYLQSSSGL
jgi:hypothetical protein